MAQIYSKRFASLALASSYQTVASPTSGRIAVIRDITVGWGVTARAGGDVRSRNEDAGGQDGRNYSQGKRASWGPVGHRSRVAVEQMARRIVRDKRGSCLCCQVIAGDLDA